MKTNHALMTSIRNVEAYFDGISQLYELHVASAVNEIYQLNKLLRRFRSLRRPVEDVLKLAADSEQQMI